MLNLCRMVHENSIRSMNKMYTAKGSDAYSCKGVLKMTNKRGYTQLVNNKNKTKCQDLTP